MTQTVIDIGIEDKARVIGYEEALTFQVGSKTIKESIELADKLFEEKSKILHPLWR